MLLNKSKRLRLWRRSRTKGMHYLGKPEAFRKGGGKAASENFSKGGGQAASENFSKGGGKAASEISPRGGGQAAKQKKVNSHDADEPNDFPGRCSGGV
jgi:hypothetical protein